MAIPTQHVQKQSYIICLCIIVQVEMIQVNQLNQGRHHDEMGKITIEVII